MVITCKTCDDSHYVPTSSGIDMLCPACLRNGITPEGYGTGSGIIARAPRRAVPVRKPSGDGTVDLTRSILDE